MFDIGWSEMTVVVVIALLVIGPKQLPAALKTVTKFTRQARRYAQDFRSGIDNIVREAELEDARKALNSVRSTDPSKALQDLVDPTGEVDEEMRALEKSAKDTAKAEPSIEAKPSSSTAAETDKTEAVDAEAAADDGEASAEAKIVKEPTQVAPAHSLRPPPGEDPFAKPTETAAAPAEESAPASAAEAATDTAAEPTSSDSDEQEKERRPA